MFWELHDRGSHEPSGRFLFNFQYNLSGFYGVLRGFDLGRCTLESSRYSKERGQAKEKLPAATSDTIIQHSQSPVPPWPNGQTELKASTLIIPPKEYSMAGRFHLQFILSVLLNQPSVRNFSNNTSSRNGILLLVRLNHSHIKAATKLKTSPWNQICFETKWSRQVSWRMRNERNGNYP